MRITQGEWWFTVFWYQSPNAYGFESSKACFRKILERIIQITYIIIPLINSLEGLFENPNFPNAETLLRSLKKHLKKLVFSAKSDKFIDAEGMSFAPDGRFWPPLLTRGISCQLRKSLQNQAKNKFKLLPSIANPRSSFEGFAFVSLPFLIIYIILTRIKDLWVLRPNPWSALHLVNLWLLCALKGI